MPEELVVFNEKPSADYLIAGWNRQWSDGGEVSSGLPGTWWTNWAPEALVPH